MDHLVSVDVKELHLNFRPSTRCSATFHVTNLMHTMSVAVHVTATSRPHLFSLHPVTPTLLPPLSSLTFTLSLSSLLTHPPLISPTLDLDSLLIKSALFPISKPHSAALKRAFSTPGGAHLFKDASIPISLVGPLVIDALLLDRTLDSAFSLSKAVAFCSRDELSALLRRSAAAGRPSFVSAFVAAGADLGSRGSDGRSPLSLAVSSGSLDAVRVLVDTRAEVDLLLDRVFHEAAGANRTDLMSVLEKSVRSGSDGWAWSTDSGGRTPVHYAAANGHLDAVRVCLTSGNGDPDQADSAGWTPLHCAAYGGFLDVAEFLIERSSFNPNIAVTFDGKKTPLDLAVEGGHSHLYDVLGLNDQFFRAVTTKNLYCMVECIKRGVRVNRRDQNGWTALHRAAFGGWIEIVRVLIENGAQLDAVDDVGFTPLRCAVEAGHVEVALVLVGHGAKARLKGVKGADLFSMKLDGCGGDGHDVCNSLSSSFCSDNQVIEK